MLEACCQFAAPMERWSFALPLAWGVLIFLAMLTCPPGEGLSKSFGGRLLVLGVFLFANIQLLAIEITLIVVSIAAVSDGLMIHPCPEAFGDFHVRSSGRNGSMVASPVIVMVLLSIHIFVIREAAGDCWTKVFGTSDKVEKSPGSKESK